MTKLTPEEKRLEDSLEEWVPVSNFESEKKRLESVASSTTKKTKRITLRITEKDFHSAHIRALEEGLPYQTLLSSIIHKFLNGKLVEHK